MLNPGDWLEVKATAAGDVTFLNEETGASERFSTIAASLEWMKDKNPSLFMDVEE